MQISIYVQKRVEKDDITNITGFNDPTQAKQILTDLKEKYNTNGCIINYTDTNLNCKINIIQLKGDLSNEIMSYFLERGITVSRQS